MVESDKVRVVLLATPEFGVPTLRALVDHGFQVAGVVCQPDRAAGRGLQVTAPAVKRAALEKGLPVFQFPSLRKPEALATLAALNADVFLVAAYGLYIPDEVVALPPRGCLNLHPSLLPRHRGASPVTAAILAGDAETGVTVLLITSEMDAGDIVAQARTPIGADETAGALTARLGEWGAGVYVDAATRWLRGEVKPWAQDGSQATWSERLTREDGRLDWRKGAGALARQVRALDPWPGTHTSWKGAPVSVLAAVALPDWRGEAAPGTVLRIPQGIAVATPAGALLLKMVQVAGKRTVPALDFANGARGFVGAVLGDGAEGARTVCSEIATRTGTVDAHIHLFPPDVREHRQRYLDRDPFFAHLYGSPKARMVSVEQTIADMDRDGVEEAVIAGWPWQAHEACVEHNTWAMAVVRQHPDRFAALAVIQPEAGQLAVQEIERCLDGGMVGVGELNADGQGFRLDSPGVLAVANLCAERGAPFLLHSNEPVGHVYPGKGTLSLTAIYDFIRAVPELRLVLAHWGGGLPFYELMPEVRRAATNVFYDTAASPLLYDPRVFRMALEMVGARKVLFGSDYPLNLYPGSGGKPGFRRFMDEIRSLDLGAEEEASVLGGNARRVFDLASQARRTPATAGDSSTIRHDAH